MRGAAKLGHLALWAMVAQSPAQENIFIIRWLATALKQRRFSRETNADVERLLKQGRQLGVNAKLLSKMNYLWIACTNELSGQSDLFRLTYALETARDTSWSYCLLSDREWAGKKASDQSSEVNSVFLSRSNLDIAFDDDGKQVNLLIVYLTGDVPGIDTIFSRCGWHMAHDGSETDFIYKFTAYQDV